jgi:hypothetical protein
MSNIKNNYELIRSTTISEWFISKWTRRLEEVRTDPLRSSHSPEQIVATQMRKQGVPVDIAVSVLCAKSKS